MTKVRTSAIAGAAAVALFATGAFGQSSADIEAANEQLARSFFAEASNADLDDADDLGAYYRRFLADDVTYQYLDNRIAGLEDYIARAAPKLAAVRSYAIEPDRLVVMGNTVLSERTDSAVFDDGQEFQARVTSVFLIADGKIAEWREYPPLEQATEADVSNLRSLPRTLGEIEAANEQLVRRFLALSADIDYDNPDPAYLWEYLTEDFVYQYGDLRIEGLETFIAQQAPTMSSVASAVSDVRRVAVMGNVVLNERVDVATLKDGSERRWTVSSVMRIADGKIAEWRDYPMPDAAPSP